MPKNDHAGGKRRPEKKFGPYPGGIGVAIWLNSAETEWNRTTRPKLQVACTGSIHGDIGESLDRLSSRC